MHFFLDTFYLPFSPQNIYIYHEFYIYIYFLVEWMNASNQCGNKALFGNFSDIIFDVFLSALVGIQLPNNPQDMICDPLRQRGKTW